MRLEARASGRARFSVRPVLAVAACRYSALIFPPCFLGEYSSVTGEMQSPKCVVANTQFGDPERRGGHPGIGRLREMRMHVLAFPNANCLSDRGRTATSRACPPAVREAAPMAYMYLTEGGHPLHPLHTL